MSDQRVKDAFNATRKGRSAEYVICDAEANRCFIKAVRESGFEGTEAEINSHLLNLRKQNALKDCPTVLRKQRDPHLKRYRNAVLNAVRLVERQFRKNVDDVICDPEMRAQFDALVQFLCPGTSAFESQYAALNLRKSNRLKPEPVGQVMRAVESGCLSLDCLERKLDELPTAPGVYIFFDEDVTLYAGKADNLRSRVSTHVSTWTFRDLIRQIRERRRPVVFVVYHELPVSISTRELAAYELELIRSRDPEHNRAGKAVGTS